MGTLRTGQTTRPLPPAGTRPRRRPGLRGTARLGLAAGALIVALLILGQVLLPGIVASKLRSSLRGAATGVHISVKATPALELLFGHADRVVMSAAVLRPIGTANIKALLERTRETGSLEATVGRLITQRLELDHVVVSKRGSQITTSAAVNRNALGAALPAGISVRPASGGSQAISLSAHITVFGRTIVANALLEARDGKIEIVPESSLLPSITVFTDPQLDVDTLKVFASGADYTFTAHGHLT
jgi:hypothetical protein